MFVFKNYLTYKRMFSIMTGIKTGANRHGTGGGAQKKRVQFIVGLYHTLKYRGYMIIPEIEIKIKFKVTLWDAFKMRIARFNDLYPIIDAIAQNEYPARDKNVGYR